MLSSSFSQSVPSPPLPSSSPPSLHPLHCHAMPVSCMLELQDLGLEMRLPSNQTHQFFLSPPGGRGSGRSPKIAYKCSM